MALPVMPGLSFAPGVVFMNETARSLGLPISRQASDSASFALVVAFGRCKFRLDTCSVGLILQATIGGSAPTFVLLNLRTERSSSSSLPGEWAFLLSIFVRSRVRNTLFPFTSGAMAVQTGAESSPSSWRKKIVLGAVPPGAILQLMPL
jgi:hypothetical protein